MIGISYCCIALLELRFCVNLENFSWVSNLKENVKFELHILFNVLGCLEKFSTDWRTGSVRDVPEIRYEFLEIFKVFTTLLKNPWKVSWGSRPLPLFHTVQIVSSNSSTNLEETLWKFSLKTKESIKTMYQQHFLEVFQRYFRKYTKAWLSPVRLIYSHSLLHNIISNRTDVNAHFLS